MFKTDDYIFRKTVLGEALSKTGVPHTPTLVREPRIEITGTRSHVIKPRPDNGHSNRKAEANSMAYRQSFRTWQREQYS